MRPVPTTKALAAQLVACGAMLEMFDWTPDDGGRTIRYNVSFMRARLMAFPRPDRKVQIDPESFQMLVEYVRARGTYDPARVLDLTVAEAAEPVLIVLCEDGANILVDGVHRVLRAAADGQKTVVAYIIPDAEFPKMDPMIPPTIDWEVARTKTWENIDTRETPESTVNALLKLLGKPAARP